MAQSYDGTFSTAIQHGAKQVILPLKAEGNYYATIARRNYVAAPATSYAPILAERSVLTALLKYSDDLSQTPWTKAAATGTASAGTDCEGGSTATKLAEDNTNAAHNASQAMIVASGALAFGVLAKAGARTQFRLRIYNATDGSLGSTVFNLSTGAITSGTGSIKRLLNGWFWCSITASPTVANSTAFIDLANDGTTFSYAGTTGSGILLWRITAYLAAAIGPAIQTAASTRAVTSLPVDADDPQAFLLMEDELDSSMLEMSVARWAREYANVPRETSVPSSITLTKPSISGTFPQVYGGFRLFQPDTTLPQYDAYFKQTVTSDSGIPGYYPTGGTYTITFAGYTTGALNYNDTAGTVQTALNALTSVSNRGNVVVTGSYNSAGGFVITFNAYAQITIATGSLTGGTISKTESLVNNGYSQTLSAYIAGSQANILFPNSPTDVDLTYTATKGTFAGNAVGSSQYWTLAGGVAPYYNGTWTGGTFTVKVGGSTSAALAYNCSIQDVQDAYDSLAAGIYTVTPMFNYTYGSDSMVWTSASVLSTNYKAIGFVVTANNTAASGGTYTLTAFTQTTAAIAHNATAATVEGALNALSNVAARGNCAVSGSLVDGFSFTFTNAVMTTSGASLTPSGSASAIAVIDGGIGRIQRATFSNLTSFRDLYIASHGIVFGDTIYLRATAGPTYYSEITGFSVPDANTIRLVVSPSDAFAAAVAIDECGKRTKQSYEPGTSYVRAVRVLSFYLPGVTLNVDSATDILVPQNQADGPSLLLAIFAGTGTINVRVGEITRWMGSEILSLEKVTVLSSDI
jgi:hypothetical protein